MKKIIQNNSAENTREVEVKEQYAGGAIKIEVEFDEKLDREVSYVNILGVRVKRRDPEHDKNPHKPDEFLPGFNGNPEKFKTFSFGPAELEFLRAALMRYAIGQHTLFLGPPGFGKSRMIEFFSHLMNVPFFRVQCERGMEVQQQFLWTYVRDNGGWKGRMGPLPMSMMQGGIILADELPNLEPSERQVILEPTEMPHNPTLTGQVPTLHMQDYPGHEVTVEAVPGWFLAASGNFREGQGVDEIFHLTEREERRVRPYMLDQLPPGTNARRMAGKYLKNRGDLFGDLDSIAGTPDRLEYPPLENHEYYPEGVAELPDEVVQIASEFFDQVHMIISEEVLKDLKQDPKVFLREAEMRAFDHFMRFLILNYKEDSDDIMSILSSAERAIQFYYVNSFRIEAKIKVPAPFLEEVKRDIPSIDSMGRAPMRKYLAWRINKLLTQKLWKTPENLQISFKGRLQKFVGMKVDEESAENKILPKIRVKSEKKVKILKKEEQKANQKVDNLAKPVEEHGPEVEIGNAMDEILDLLGSSSDESK